MSEQQQQEKSKEAKKYKENIDKLTALLGGKGLLTKSRIPNGDIQIAMMELVKEDKATRIEAIKEKVKSMIKKKMEFDAAQKKLLAEFEKAVEEKQREFNKEFDEVMHMVENIKQIEEDYLATLTDVANPPSETTN